MGGDGVSDVAEGGALITRSVTPWWRSSWSQPVGQQVVGHPVSKVQDGVVLYVVAGVGVVAVEAPYVGGADPHPRVQSEPATVGLSVLLEGQVVLGGLVVVVNTRSDAEVSGDDGRAGDWA